MRSQEITRRVRGYFKRLRSAFANALRGASASGDLSAQHDPDVLSDFLVGAVIGLSAMARAGRPRGQIQHYIDTVLASLD